MHKFNSEMAAYLRDELGCKQLINACNWKTADMMLTQDAEYWAYSANDVIARNCYVEVYHQGVQAGWNIQAGDTYADVSMIKNPVDLPINVKKPLGRTFMLPETLWVPPDLYQSEGPLMVAAQTALTGIDITCWSGCGIGGWYHSDWFLFKWVWNSPVTLGQFPAAALIYRQGLVQPGEPAVVEHRHQQDLWDRKTPIISEQGGWDPNHNAGDITLTSAAGRHHVLVVGGRVKTTVDPLAYLVGPVRVAYGSDPAKTQVVDLAKYIDRKNKTVQSITGQIETDYGRGVYRVNSPLAQAAAGFLKDAGPQHLGDVDITCGNKYATVVVVPLDGKPIRESGKVLVQVGTVCRPAGWTTVPARARINGKQSDCFRIISRGKDPLQVENTEVTVSVANARLTKAVLLDVNGMATQTPVELKQSGGKAIVVLPANTLYLVLQ